VGAPGGSIAPPVAVGSAILAAGRPPISTVIDPKMMISAPQLSVILAAGNPAINTVGSPGGIIGVGIPEVAGLLIISVMRAAGFICLFVLNDFCSDIYRNHTSYFLLLNSDFLVSDGLDLVRRKASLPKGTRAGSPTVARPPTSTSLSFAN
jgi:hypothetical protein